MQVVAKRLTATVMILLASRSHAFGFSFHMHQSPLLMLRNLELSRTQAIRSVRGYWSDRGCVSNRRAATGATRFMHSNDDIAKIVKMSATSLQSHKSSDITAVTSQVLGEVGRMVVLRCGLTAEGASSANFQGMKVKLGEKEEGIVLWQRFPFVFALKVSQTAGELEETSATVINQNSTLKVDETLLGKTIDFQGRYSRGSSLSPSLTHPTESCKEAKRAVEMRS